MPEPLPPVVLPNVCEACAGGLAALLAAPEGAGLVARFRPLADLTAGGLFGHLADLHGPPDALLRTWRRLFETACLSGLAEPLFRCYCRTVVETFVSQRGQGLLLLPLGAAAGVLGEGAIRLIVAVCERYGLPVGRVLLVHDGLPSMAAEPLRRVIDAAVAARRAGFPLAAGVLHCPRAETLLWGQVRPDYALIEDGVLGLLDAHLIAGSGYGALIRAVAADGRRVLALGVDSAARLEALQRLPVTAAAGDFIGRPAAVPTRTLSAAAHRAIAARVSPPAGETRAGPHLLERLLQPVPPVSPQAKADEVFALFEQNPDLRGVAVVRDGTPLGMISRYDMIDNMARPYRHELYGRKSCTRFMDAQPLIVDLHLHLADLSDLLVQAHPRHLITGFVICDQGAYLGIGSVQDLVREVTVMQLEAARYANPLSQLPGNVPINQTIDRLLASGRDGAIAWCDLDHFKPFNDVYGYARGDEVIRLTARLLGEVCDPEADFLGHIGGDDFVLVLQSADWQGRCRRALAAFGQEICGFFSRDDAERGGYVTANRQGRPEFHPLTSLSIGVVLVRPGRFASHLEVSAVAAEVKKMAKGLTGNSLYVDQRQG